MFNKIKIYINKFKTFIENILYKAEKKKEIIYFNNLESTDKSKTFTLKLYDYNIDLIKSSPELSLLIKDIKIFAKKKYICIICNIQSVNEANEIIDFSLGTHSFIKIEQIDTYFNDFYKNLKIKQSYYDLQKIDVITFRAYLSKNL